MGEINFSVATRTILASAELIRATIGGMMEQVGFLAVAAIVSGVGAYLGAYLKKKGENVATHEDLQMLGEQVKATTEATKRIESRILDEIWDRQKRWELKKEIILELCRALTKSEVTLTIATAAVSLAAKVPQDTALHKKATEEFEKCKEALFAMSSLRAAVVLVTNENVITVFLHLQNLLVNAAAHLNAGGFDREDAQERLQLFRAAMTELEVAMRNEIGFPTLRSNAPSATQGPDPSSPGGGL